MDKKERISRLLNKLDNDALETIEEAISSLSEDEPQEETTVHKPRRRGRGKKRRNANSSSPKSERKPSRRSKTKARGGSGRQCRSSPIDTDRKRENKFEDFIENVSLDGDEQRELTSASREDKAARSKGTRSKKGKRPNPMIWVRCRSCGEEEEVSSALVYDAKRYKCNQCSGSACG